MNIIMGAGDFGREVYEFHKFVGVEVAGFFDEKAEATHLRKKPIYNSLKDIKKTDEVCFIAGTGNAQINKKFFNMIILKNLKLAEPLICDSYVGENTKIGKGVVVCPKSVLTCDINIGDFSIINYGCTIGHDCLIGKFCVISPNCSLSGYTTIENEVFLGTSVATIPKVNISKNIVIGASSLVTKNLTENGTYVGIPAKRIK